MIHLFDDVEARDKLYKASNSLFPENISVIDELVRTRHQIARILKYSSFANWKLENHMAKTPEKVMSVLVNLSEKIKPRVKYELLQVQEKKSLIDNTDLQVYCLLDYLYISDLGC